jgi:hypothetical protein
MKRLRSEVNNPSDEIPKSQNELISLQSSGINVNIPKGSQSLSSNLEKLPSEIKSINDKIGKPKNAKISEP